MKNRVNVIALLAAASVLIVAAIAFTYVLEFSGTPAAGPAKTYGGGDGIVASSTLAPVETPAPAAASPVSSNPATTTPAPAAAQLPLAAAAQAAAASGKGRTTARTLPPAPTSFGFVISSFNMLGNSHTASGGKDARMASGTTRTHWALDVLNHHAVDVAGFQEFQTPQVREFLARAGSTYAVYPGLALGDRNAENSLAWRTSVFDVVETHTVDIPYFNGNVRQMPYVLLRHKATGALAWFINVHNPADTRQFPDQERWRDRATAIEIDLIRQLDATRTPVFITGDMNEREDYFCAMTSRTSMHAARGGTNVGGVCDARRPRAVDWIFGSSQVSFPMYFEDRGSLVQRTTDHPVILAKAQLPIPAAARR